MSFHHVFQSKQNMNKFCKVDPAPVQRICVKKYSDNCLACIIRPSMIIGSLIGLAPIISHCPHTNANLSKCIFERSRLLSIFPIVHLFYILYVLFNNALEFMDNVELSKIRLVILLTSGLHEINSMTIVLGSGLFVQARIKELTGLAAIISNSGVYNIPEMFSETTMKTLKRYILLNAAAIVLVTIVHLVHCIIFLPIFYSIKTCLSLMLQLTFTLQLRVAAYIYKLLIEKCYAQIKLCLEQRMNDLTKKHQLFVVNIQQQMNVEVRYKPKINNGATGSILHRLQKLQRFYCAVYDNFEQMNEYLNPAMLLCIMGVCIMLVMNYYLLLNFWFAGENTSNAYVLLFIRSFSVLAALILVLMTYSSLQTSVSTIFVYNFNAVLIN